MIRVLEKSDIPCLKEIVSKIYQDEPGMPAFLEKDLMDMWSNANIRPTYLVKEEKSTLIGFIGFKEAMIDFETYQVFWMMVDPLHQRKGVGRELLLSAKKEIESKGAKDILISTLIPAVFKKYGFVELKKRNSFYVMSYLL